MQPLIDDESAKYREGVYRAFRREWVQGRCDCPPEEDVFLLAAERDIVG
jgi:hypothetical protein